MKTLFLTGAATGIGREIAKLFYNNNYNITLLDLNEEELKQTTQGWHENRYLSLVGSVTNPEFLKGAAQQCVEKFGKIDSLILNAGIHQSNTVLSITDEELDTILSINVKGYIYTLKAVLPQMIETGGGTIVVSVSDQAFIGKGMSFSYGLTKGAIGQMIKNIAVDYGRQGISISGVCAGTTITPLALGAMQRWADRDFNGNLQKALEVESEAYTIKRLGTAAEVAQMYLYLANAPFVTGSLHLIDGGLTAK
ncbi:MAG: SDR family oxidoreductase [Rikenellaceae bacterium]